MPDTTLKKDRLDAWFDGSSVRVIAVSASDDALELSADALEPFIAKLQGCLREMRTLPGDNALDFST